jgi:hypothetical protein
MYTCDFPFESKANLEVSVEERREREGGPYIRAAKWPYTSDG